MLLPLHQNNLLESAASATKTYSVTFTRLALYGGARPLYGSFDGKVAAAPEVAAATETAAGRPRRSRYSRRRRRMYVEIDGQTFEVGSYEEAQRLLQRARELAEQKAQADTEVPDITRVEEGQPVDIPLVATFDPDLEDLVAEFRQDLRDIYEEAAEQNRLRALAARRAMMRDENDAITVLLLS